MAKKRKKELSMRKIREILRLGLTCKLGQHKIAESCSTSSSTVNKYIGLAEASGLDYPKIEEMTDGELRQLLKIEAAPNVQNKWLQPDWYYIHQELKKKGVTLQLLWEEYKEENPDGYQSSQFNELYNRWKNKLNPSMRQTHNAGEKMFVDYSGQTIPIIDRITGSIKKTELFVAVLGASNYTYAECTWSQSLSDWIGSHVRAFEYFHGVSEIIVPDNLKSGVTTPCWYEPDINPTYNDLSRHYGTVIIPARVRKPKDKAKVEAGVLLAERWILAALRNRTFFSLSELNQSVSVLLVKLNQKPFQKLDGSRLSWFESIEKKALLPLPQHRYVFSEWQKGKVNMDYHVELKKHYYSVPYKLVKESLDIRYTGNTVEIFFKGSRVASHIRDDKPGHHTTLKEHMPTSHQKYLEWSPSRIINWAGTVGESTSNLVETIMASRRHPELGYRSCMGVMRLSKQYSNDRLESACKRAIAIGGPSYKSVRSILEKGLDLQPLSIPAQQPVIDHENIRGGNYFN